MASKEPIKSNLLYVLFQDAASQFLSGTLLHTCVQAAFIVSALEHLKSQSTQTASSTDQTSIYWLTVLVL